CAKARPPCPRALREPNAREAGVYQPWAGRGEAESPSSSSATELRRARYENITGTTNRDSSVDEVSPPTTANASGRLEDAASPSPSAVGRSPMMVAKLVMAIGTKR